MSDGRSLALGAEAGGRATAGRRDVLRELVEAARAGDGDARAALFDRYHAVLYRYAIARTGSPADAEDVVAETFVSALAALHRFRWTGAPFEAWLFRIAASKVVDLLRRRSRPTVGLDQMPVEPLDEGPGPGGRLDALEQQAEVAAAIDALPPTQRDVIVLRFLLGHSVQEVAKSLGRTEGAIKQLQARALANMRKDMER